MVRPYWRSLQTKIIGWSFVPTTIILVAVALVTFYSYQKVTEDLVVSRNRELTRLMASQFATDLTEYSDILLSLSRLSTIRDGDPIAQRSALAQSRNRLVVFDAGTLILDTRGIVVASEPHRIEVAGQDWSNHPYFRQVIRSGGPVISNVVQDGPLGQDVVALAVPITGDQGEMVGAMVGLFKIGATTTSALYGSIVKLRLGETGTAYIVDSVGRIVYHPDPTFIGASVADQPVVKQVLDGKGGADRTTDLEGRDIVAGYAPVPSTPWGLISEESWVELSGPGEGYRQFLLLLLALGIVVPTMVVFIGVRRITNPIGQLISAAREVAGGNFGQTIRSPTGDELEDLAEQFNIMSRQLAESYSDLERKVADRTRELATLNAITAVVSQSLDLETVLSSALDETLESTSMEVGAAYRLDKSRAWMEAIATRGLSDEFSTLTTRVSLGDGIAGLAATAGKPVSLLVADYAEGDVKRELQRQGLQIVVSVPLLAKGEILGALNMAARETREITDEEQSILAAIGQQVGLAVENARLYEMAEETAATAERNRLARDLHDAVSQTLFSATLIAEVLPRIWDRNQDEGRRRLEEIRQLTRGALAEMRTLLLELRPSALIDAALADLLRQLAEAVRGRARIPVELTVDGKSDLPPDVKISLYRIAQEALNNVAKHSGANSAAVSVQCTDRGVHLSVRDTGRGFDQTTIPPDHLGVGIMRERAEAIQARLEIVSAPGKGTEVSVTWSPVSYDGDDEEDEYDEDVDDVAVSPTTASTNVSVDSSPDAGPMEEPVA